MSPKQTKMYWREWKACWAAMRAADSDLDWRQANQKRHDLHRAALGYPRSSSDLENRELDAVLGAMRAWSRPADMGTQVRIQNQTRLRMLWKITNHLLPRLAELLGAEHDAEHYAMHLLLDRWKTNDHTTLSDRHLREFLMTLEQRIKRMEEQPEPAEEPA